MRSEVTRRELLAAVGAAAAASALPRSTLAQEQGDEWPAFGYDAAKTGYNPDGEGPTDAVGGAWQCTESTDSVGAAPAVADGTVYVASTDGSLTALDAASGEAVDGWPVELDEGTVSPPTVADGTVYVGSGDGSVYAVDADVDGEEAEWEFDAEGGISGGVALEQSADGEATVYAANTGGGVFAIDAATGDPLWEEPYVTEGSINSAPVVDDGVVYV
ncbi:MAG: PQQ-binding-like beta-propeller repeat protein, partial [Natrialbaceae archaeon]